MIEETNADFDCEPVALSGKAKDEQGKIMLTKAGAMRTFGLSRWQIDNAIAKGQVPFVKISKRLMIPAERARRMLGLAA